MTDDNTRQRRWRPRVKMAKEISRNGPAPDVSIFVIWYITGMYVVGVLDNVSHDAFPVGLFN